MLQPSRTYITPSSTQDNPQVTREIAQLTDSRRCVWVRHMRPHLRKLTAGAGSGCQVRPAPYDQTCLAQARGCLRTGGQALLHSVERHLGVVLQALKLRRFAISYPYV